MLVATRSVLQGAAAHGLSFWQFLRRGLDPTSIAVMLEDGAAVAGLVIAGTFHILLDTVKSLHIPKANLMIGNGHRILFSCLLVFDGIISTANVFIIIHEQLGESSQGGEMFAAHRLPCPVMKHESAIYPLK